MSKDTKSKAYESILAAEQRNISLTCKHFKKEIDTYIERLNLLHQVFCEIRSAIRKQKRPPSEVEFAVCVNSARIFCSSKALLDLVMKGYYHDANVVYRSLLENALLVACFTKDKKYLEKWKNDDLKIGKVKGELGLYSSKMTEFYGFLSDFTHANISAISQAIEFDGTDVRIFFDPQFKENWTVEMLSSGILVITIQVLSSSYSSMLKGSTNLKIVNMLKEFKQWVAKLHPETVHN